MNYSVTHKVDHTRCRHAIGREARCSKVKKDAGMTRKAIDYARLGIEACEAFTDGPAAFADFVRGTPSITAPLHVLQTSTTEKLLERLNDAKH